MISIGVAGFAYSARVWVPLSILAVAFAAYPIVGLMVWLRRAEAARSASKRCAELESSKAGVEAALAGANAELARMRVAAEVAQGEIASLRDKVADAEQQFGAERVQGDARVSDLESRIAPLEAEATRLRASVAQYEKAVANYEEQERQRLAWHTLPQGHDLETERFAATVANALR